MLKSTHWIAAAISVTSGAVVADIIELEGIVRDRADNRMTNGYPDDYRGMSTRYPHDQTRASASEPLDLTFDNGRSESGGVYTFNSQSFFPIDGRLLGNQGLNHNYDFTFELRTQFSYVPGQTFSFTGDNHVGVFIDGIQVIGVGGVDSPTTGNVTLLAGRVFVDASFPATNAVQIVSDSMATYLNEAWSNLGLPGPCPIVAGDHFIDLDLTNGKPDTRVEFGGISATVWSTMPIKSIDVRFSDGSTEHFESVAGPQAKTVTVAGTGRNADKMVLGVWIHNSGWNKPVYFDVEGDGFSRRTLDVLFSQRHANQSNFRIDTNMALRPIPTTAMTSRN